MTAAKTGSAVAAVAAVAMAVADNNRICGGRQQSTKCSGSSGRDSDSSHCSGDHDSMALAVGRGSSAAEVTMLRAAATATTVVVNLYPFEGRNVEVITNYCQVDTNK